MQEHTSIAIEDLEHGGGADGFGYRIYAGVLPYLTGVFPLGVRGGAGGDVAVTGVNLGADSVRLTGEPAYPGGRTVPVTVGAARGPVLNRKAISLGTYPDALEREPNSDMALAQPLAIPSSVNGRIWTARGGTDDGSNGRHMAIRICSGSPPSRDRSWCSRSRPSSSARPLDSIVEVLDAQGRIVPRALVRCLARTEIALNDPDSTRRSIRLLTWNELAINDYLLIGDELLQVGSLPTHPDDDLQLRSYPGRAVGAARYLAAESLGRRGGLQGVASRARHAARDRTACRCFKSTT